MSRTIRRQMHPYIGKPIAIQHKNGRLYHGVLHSITNEGILLRPGNGAAMASMKIVKAGQEDSIVQAVSDNKDTIDATPVWWWAWWLIAFALIAGWWWLGAAGGGAYGRGYGAGVGPGYGRYGGYGRGGGLWW